MEFKIRTYKHPKTKPFWAIKDSQSGRYHERFGNVYTSQGIVEITACYDKENSSFSATAFEMILSARKYSATVNGSLTTRQIGSRAREFALQCQLMSRG